MQNILLDLWGDDDFFNARSLQVAPFFSWKGGKQSLIIRLYLLLRFRARRPQVLSEIHNHAILVYQNVEWDALAQVENGVKPGPLGIGEVVILDAEGDGFQSIGRFIKPEIDHAERLSFFIGGEALLERNFLP